MKCKHCKNEIVFARLFKSVPHADMNRGGHVWTHLIPSDVDQLTRLCAVAEYYIDPKTVPSKSTMAEPEHEV